MEREELYKKSIQVLSKAYLDGTLYSGYCEACACGNLIAAANGYEITKIKDNIFWKSKDKDYIDASWGDVCCTLRVKVPILEFTVASRQKLEMKYFKSDAKKEILSTGYELEEFIEIESAFERGYKGVDRMYNALMSVVDALDIIHKNNNKEVTKQSKGIFIKAK